MPNPTCSVADDSHSDGRLRRGMCDKHYRRFVKWGDPLYLPPRDKPVGNRVNHPPRANAADRDSAGRRICTLCGTAKDDAAFPKDRNSYDGLRARCKECHAAAQNARYPEIRDRVVKQRQEYRDENIERVREVDRARYRRNREKRKALALESRHIRRARELSADFDEGITVKALRAVYGDNCYFCGTKMIFVRTKRGVYIPAKATIEHLTPISRGGSHTWDNCVLSCHACNLSKGRKTEGEFRAKHAGSDPDVFLRA